MKREETLHRIKDVEDRVRRSKDEALAEQERILRAARREALELKDVLRVKAEKRYEEVLKEAEGSLAKEKASLLEGGRREAAALAAKADANIERAVERLIEKFKGALNA
ncbi:MAG: hypothetical protein A3K68_05775 [Euryarchaeota archaeon RBG_16_68_13]|nr:MAG: hypothetical protein A3K68_05775 [Euryarchaeota archaeon RBG_16_68_13]